MRQRRWLELIKNYEFEVSLSSWKGECGVRCPKPQALTRAFPPSPLPLRIGFKTGASPSSPPAPFLLLEHDSSATYPLPSPSPSPPPHGELDPCAPFSSARWSVTYLVPSCSCRTLSPPPPATRLCRRLGMSTSRRLSSPSLSTACPGEPLPPTPCSTCSPSSRDAYAAATSRPLARLRRPRRPGPTAGVVTVSGPRAPCHA
jgi:hypothetical protein